jgi:MFS family permease
MLNKFHVLVSGGIVIGGLISYLFLEQFHLDWRIMVAILFLPAVIYGWMFLKLEFPKTERVQRGYQHKRNVYELFEPFVYNYDNMHVHDLQLQN